MGDKGDAGVDKGQSASPPAPPPVGEIPPKQPIDQSFGFAIPTSGHGHAKPKTPMQKFKLFLYNKRHKTVLGRTGWSWLHIGIFYMIFYPVIFAFFVMILVTSLHFMPIDEPRSVGKNSLLNFSPGLGFRPNQHGQQPTSSLIWFNKRNEKDVEFYVNQLTRIVKAESEQNAKLKGIDCRDSSVRPGDGEFCKVYEGLDWGPCTPENKFGYKDGTPCVLIRLNKILNWVPAMEIDVAKKNSKFMKSMLKNSGNIDITGHVWIDCHGETSLDRELLGEINIYPSNRPKPGVSSLPPNYFPYKRGKVYLSPFIMVQFSGPTAGAIIKIRCFAYNEHVKMNKRDGLGTVEIELLVDQ